MTKSIQSALEYETHKRTGALITRQGGLSGGGLELKQPGCDSPASSFPPRQAAQAFSTPASVSFKLSPTNDAVQTPDPEADAERLELRQEAAQSSANKEKAPSQRRRKQRLSGERPGSGVDASAAAGDCSQARWSC